MQYDVFNKTLFMTSGIFLSAVFFLREFLAYKANFKELQLKGNLFDFSQILTVPRLTYKKNTSGNFKL